MYQGFAYVSQNGALKRDDYRPFSQHADHCGATPEKLKTGAMKDIGYVEYDRRTNQQLKEILQKNTVSMSMYTTGMLGAYKRGIVTEEFMKCSYPDNEVNHGVVMVGYGKVSDSDIVRGRCKEYWIIRNSWGPEWGE
jgi:C1A family cysteine protease